MTDTMFLQTFLQTLGALELAKLRHEAIQVGDKETKRLIDEELKRRSYDIR